METIAPLFAIPVVKNNIDRKFTENELQLFLEDIPMGKDRKGIQNHQSVNFTLFDTFAEELKDIKKFCTDQLKFYLEEIDGADTDHARLRITQSWLNKTKPGEYHHKHHHPNSYLSAVLYIKCLPNDHINIENRLDEMYNNMKFKRKKNTLWNSNGAMIDVTKGDLIIFPSWVPHSVDVNETKDVDRISLSFNTFPVGEMGDYNDATYLKL